MRWLRRLLRTPRRPAPARPRGYRPARTAAGDVRRVLTYAPQTNGTADPGEVVWALVDFEEAGDEAKDRPVLVVGRKDPWTVLGLMLSSRPKGPEQRNWLSLGTGSWDRAGRPSWVRLDRVLEVNDRSVRREGAALDAARFDLVAERLRAEHGWR
jgi:hypothetical protein